jgi:hypothetical protein
LPVSQGKCLVIQADEQWTDTVDRLDIAGFRELDPDSVHFVEHWQFAQMSRLADYVREQGIVARVTSPNWNFMPNYQTIDLKYLTKI